jgi:hypothetical protein
MLQIAEILRIAEILPIAEVEVYIQPFMKEKAHYNGHAQFYLLCMVHIFTKAYTLPSKTH